MLGSLRKKIEELLSAITITLVKSNLDPNLITATGLIFSVISSTFFYFRSPLIGALFLAISGLMDVLDGMVARKAKKETKLGNVLDSILDRYSDFFPLMAIGIAGLAEIAYVALSIFGCVIPSYVRAKLEINIEANRIKGKLIIGERADRLVLLILGALIYPIYHESLNIALILIFLLGNIAAILRLIYNLDNLK